MEQLALTHINGAGRALRNVDGVASTNKQLMTKHLQTPPRPVATPPRAVRLLCTCPATYFLSAGSEACYCYCITPSCPDLLTS